MAKRPPELTLAEQPHNGARGHLGQRHWLDATGRYFCVVLAMGRRAGKSTLVPFVFTEDMAALGDEFYQAAYMAQGHPQAKEMYRACLEAWEAAHIVNDKHGDEGQDRWIEVIPIRGVDEQGNEIGKCRGGKIWFVSGEESAHPGFHGKGLHRAILDEASLCPESAWSITLMPMLAGGGKALIIGSPHPEGIGFAWFEEIWLKGCPNSDTRDPDYLSFNAPTECNPTLSVTDIARLRRAAASPEEEKCLFDGLFCKDMGAVFTHLPLTFTLAPTSTERLTQYGHRWVYRASNPSERVVIGLDFAEAVKGDATVASAISIDTREQLEVIRLRGVLYEDQLPIVDSLYRRMGPNTVVMCDGKIAGGHVLNVMRARYGTSIIPVKWANGGVWDKATAVTHGIHLFQAGATEGAIGWKLMQIPEQEEEFRLYGKSPLPSGGWKYGAPSGKHDDFVSANLFAAYRIPHIERKLQLEEDHRTHDLSATPPGSRAHHELMIATQAIDTQGSVYTLR